MVKCNLCNKGLCDEDLNFHIGEYFIENKKEEE